MKQLDGAGQAKHAALDEAMIMVQRLHGIVERMAIAVRSNQDLGGFRSQFTRAATPLVGLLKPQFGMIAEQVSSVILVSSRGASDQTRLRSMREGIAQIRTAVEISQKKVEDQHAVEDPGAGSGNQGTRR